MPSTTSVMVSIVAKTGRRTQISASFCIPFSLKLIHHKRTQRGTQAAQISPMCFLWFSFVFLAVSFTACHGDPCLQLVLIVEGDRFAFPYPLGDLDQFAIDRSGLDD